VACRRRDADAQRSISPLIRVREALDRLEGASDRRSVRLASSVRPEAGEAEAEQLERAGPGERVL
jgi:hypothetical protein